MLVIHWQNLNRIGRNIFFNLSVPGSCTLVLNRLASRTIFATADLFIPPAFAAI